MPTLNIKGRIMYFPGTSPCDNAQIEIYDVDEGGNGDDVIFTGTTNNDGYYQGTTSNWDDRNTKRVRRPIPPFLTFSIDIPDVLILQAKVKQNGNTLGRIPVMIAPSGEIQPIITSWSPPPPPKPRVNGVECNDGYELFQKIKAVVDAGQTEIKIEIYGSDAGLLTPLTQGNDKIRELLIGKFNVGNPTQMSNVVAETVITTELIIALAIFVVAIGVSALLFCCGVGMLYALHQGFNYVKSKQEFEIPGMKLKHEIELKKPPHP